MDWLIQTAALTIEGGLAVLAVLQLGGAVLLLALSCVPQCRITSSDIMGSFFSGVISVVMLCVVHALCRWAGIA